MKLRERSLAKHGGFILSGDIFANLAMFHFSKEVAASL